MKPIHKFVWALMVSLALLLSGCGGSSGGGALGGEDMERAETQTAALKMAYDAAVAALVTLEDDFSDATQAEVDAVEEKLTALKAAVAAAADVSDEVKAMYSVQAIETRLAAGKKSARLALEAEVAEQAKMARAETQTSALKAAYDAALAALVTLEDDTSDATQAQVDDVETKLAALKTAIEDTADVSEEVKAMYPVQTIEDRLTEAKKDARLALEAEAAEKAREAAKAERAEPQVARLKAAYDAAVAAVETLEDDTDDATRAKEKDADDKLKALKDLIADDDPETGTPDVSDEVKEMYSAEALETRLDAAKKLARVALARDGVREEAGEAIAAAGTAIMAAGTAIEGAREAIEDAETTVEGLAFIRIQTGSGDIMVAQDVEKARMAYDAAKAAYDAAKAAYDTAKGKHDMDRDEADTLEKANALKVAADAAKMAADAAKMAADAAKTAAETAKTDADTDAEAVSMTALRYDDGAYRVGDMSINPTAIGKVKGTRTEGGKEIVTGFEALNVRSVEVPFATYAAGPPVVAGHPLVEARELMIGGKYDSADDDTRLRLITHYTSNTKEIGVYTGHSDTAEYTLEPTDDAPYGMFDPDGDAGSKTATKVHKARSIGFYRLSLSGRGETTSPLGDNDALHSNLGGLYLLGDTEPLPVGSVFYYDNKSTRDDEPLRGWLKLVKTSTAVDGTVSYVYQKIQGYDYPDDADYLGAGVDEAQPTVKFPESKAYEHINYGIWATLDEDGEDSAELGIGFVRTLTASSMTSNLPTTGSATYHGNWVANIRARHVIGEGAITEHAGKALVTAKFAGDRTVTVNLVKGNRLDAKGGAIYGTLAILEGAITSGTSEFKGTKVTNVLNLVSNTNHFGNLDVSTAGSTGDTPDYTGTFNGAFFGDEAAEVGGVFDFTSEGKLNGEFRGAFGGVKQPATESSDNDDS